MSRAGRGLLAGAPLVAAWPVVHWYGLKLRYGSDDLRELVALGAFALVPLFARRRGEEGRPSLLPSATGVLACALAARYASELAGAVVLVLTLAGTWPALLGRRFHVAQLGLGALALPVLPLFDLHLAGPLRALAAEGAALLLRLGGSDALAAGTTLRAGGAIVAVDAPCAGLAMIWSGLFVTCLAALVFRLSTAATVVGWLVALVLVVAANSLRAATLFWVETGGLGAEHPWLHESVGVLVQFATVVLILLLLRPLSDSSCDTSPAT